MGAPFPLTPAPAGYTAANWKVVSQPRNGIHYLGGTAPQNIQCSTSATSYQVYDYDGLLVSTGPLSSQSTCTPAVPAGGWICGHYTILFLGSVFDAQFAYCLGATMFVVFPVSSHFVTAPAGNTASGGFLVDSICGGITAVGVDRFAIDNAAAPTTGFNTIAQAQAAATDAQTYWTNPATGTDAARPRTMFLAFPNGAVDYISFLGGFVSVYCANGTLDGSKVFAQISAGSISGAKIRVFYPNNSTLVETFDNLADNLAAQAAINGISNYIWVWNQYGSSSFSNAGPTAVGNAKYTGVGTVVAALYPYGVTRYEGPSNEPGLDYSNAAEIAQQMRCFQGSVHAGNASAIAIGPCTVSIQVGQWQPFLAAGGGQWCDEFDCHAYSAMTNGDLNLSRTSLDAFFDVIDQYGFSSKPVWQTESTQANFVCQFGVLHTHHARVQTFAKLIWEEYGVVKEHNNPWYAFSHGFWGYPSWLQNNDGSLLPQACLDFVLSDRVFGKQYQSRFTFPGVYDHVFCGWRYADAASNDVAIVMTTSRMQTSSVTFATSAAGPLTVHDPFGNVSTVAVSGGKFTVNVREIPTYVEIPHAATLTVDTVNGMPSGLATALDVTLDRTYVQPVHGLDPATITSGDFIYFYTQGGTYGIFRDGTGFPAVMPTSVTIEFPRNVVRGERIVIWCGSVWQNDSTLVNFTVDASLDGSAWTQIKAVDLSADQTSRTFQAGANSTSHGCEWITFCPDIWIFDLDLGGAVDMKYLRLNVTDTTWGGEPTQDTSEASGQSDYKHMVIQRVAVLESQGASNSISAKSYGTH